MTDYDKGEASMPFPVRGIARPDPLSDATVEAVARAYCKRMGLDPDERIRGTLDSLKWWRYTDRARAAIIDRLAVDEVLG
jgi:hypothetical protein